MGENIDTSSSDYLNQIRRTLTATILSSGQPRPKQGGFPTRTPAEDLAELPTRVVFGLGDRAREFELYPKPHLEADEWRVAAMAIIQIARPALLAELKAGSTAEMAQSAESVLNLASVIINGAIPAITELVFAWEPSLDRDLILRELGATDAQIATAFVACLQMAFPFHSTLKQVGRLIQGSQSQSAPTPEATGTAA